MPHRPRPVLAGTVGVLGAALALAPLATVPARAASDHLVINEAYGGGGNSGATLTHDFVELFNGAAAPISVEDWTVKYYSAAGNLGNSCTLAGSVAPGDHFLVQQAKGSGGTTALPTPDATCSAAMSGSAGSVVLSTASGVVVDTVGYGSATIKEGSPAPRLTNTTSASRTGGIDTDDNSKDFTAGAPTPQNSGTTGGDTDPEPEPESPTVSIAEIQGTGASSPLVGQKVTTRGVVTAVYPEGGFSGVYLQTPGTGGSAKGPGEASDGIFLYSAWAAGNLAIGDCVVVDGSEVKEFNGLTELDGGYVTEAEVACDPVVATELATLPATDAEKEPYEGMLVHPQGTWAITNNYQLNQYGQLGLTPGTEPLYTATDMVAPGAEAEAYEAGNVAKYITLDDGSSWDYLRNTTAKDSPLPYLSQDEPMRTGSQVTFSKPVILDYRFQWNFQPTGQIVGASDDQDPLTTEDDREATAPAVGGDVKVATFNVLNYFTALGRDEDGCGFYADRQGNPVATDYCQVRGAYSEAAFADQQQKIVAAINELDADVVSLEEIEASTAITYLDKDRDAALAALVDALNAAGGSWAYVPSPRVVPTNEDVIRTAFIYDPTRVQLLGASEILMDGAFADARYPLAQKFKLRKAGSPFVVVTNHFKSKGSGADDGTGQGLSNPSREAQARALTSWVEQVYADEAVLLAGDFNAYSRETPVQIIEAAGYTNLAKAYEPGSATYQFSGRLGSLDHVFANEKALLMVTGAGVWDINADESIAMQYSRRNYNVIDFHTGDPFASSDHDPIVVGLAAKGAKR